MANLMDSIRRNSANLVQQQTPGMQDQSALTAALLRAKSGKAVASPEITASSLGEQQAVTQGAQGVQQAGQQAYMQQQGQQAQAVAQEQGAQLQQADIAQGRKFSTLKNKMDTENLLRAAEQDRGKLDLRKNAAEVNQLVQGMRLSNDKYISELQREGARTRLDDAASFSREYSKAVFGDNEELVQKNLGNRSILDASDAEYKKSLARMGVDDAWIMYRNNQATEAARTKWEGIGGIATAGIGAAASYKSTPDDELNSSNDGLDEAE